MAGNFIGSPFSIFDILSGATRDSSLPILLMSYDTYCLNSRPDPGLRLEFTGIRPVIGLRMAHYQVGVKNKFYEDLIAERPIILDLFGRMIFGESFVHAMDTSKRSREIRQLLGRLLSSYTSVGIVDQLIYAQTIVAELYTNYSMQLVRGLYDPEVFAFGSICGITTRQSYIRHDVTAEDMPWEMPGTLDGIDMVKLATSYGEFIQTRYKWAFVIAAHTNMMVLHEYFKDSVPPKAWCTPLSLGLDALVTILMADVVPTEIVQKSNAEIVFGINREDLFLQYVEDVRQWSCLGGYYRPLESQVKAYSKQWPWLPKFWDMASLPKDPVVVRDFLTVYTFCVTPLITPIGRAQGFRHDN